MAGQRLFTIIFSSLYAAGNPRHIPEDSTTFVFFQPVQSFGIRIPYDKNSAEFRRLKANIRSRFTQAGRVYDGAINDDHVKPQNICHLSIWARKLYNGGKAISL